MKRTASQGTLASFEHCFHKGEKIPLDYSMLDTGHPGKHLGTLQVVSIFAFLPKNIPGVHFMHLYAPHDIIAMKVMLLIGRAHPQLHYVKF